MKVTHRIENKVCILSPTGNIALDGVVLLRESIQFLLDDESLKGVILDFGQVNLVDSSGWGLILSIMKILEGRHARMAICNLGSKLQQNLDHIQLDKIIEIFETLEEALHSFKG